MIVNNKLEAYNIYDKPSDNYLKQLDADAHDTNVGNMDKAIKEIQKLLEEKRLTIAATSDADVIIRDMDTGEERVYKDLGYPI